MNYLRSQRIIMLLCAFVLTQPAFSRNDVPDLIKAADTLLEDVSAFTEAPDEETLAAARDTASRFAEHLKNTTGIQEKELKFIAYEKVDKETVNYLISASRCPVPFSVEMIRTLNSDMQGFQTVRYLLNEAPEGGVENREIVDAYQAEPRRSAYLNSVTKLLKLRLTEVSDEK